MKRCPPPWLSGSSRPRRLRVAHVTLGLDVGGQEKLLVEFARYADRERLRPALSVSLSTRGRLAGDVEACGWPVTALEQPPGLRPRMVLQLARLFRRVGVDVVHTHDEKPLIYAPLAARLVGVERVVHTRHGRSCRITRRQRTWPAWPPGWSTASCASRRTSARLSVEEGIRAGKVRAIWNGIDSARFAYRDRGRAGPVVTVARLSLRKTSKSLEGRGPGLPGRPGLRPRGSW